MDSTEIATPVTIFKYECSNIYRISIETSIFTLYEFIFIFAVLKSLLPLRMRKNTSSTDRFQEVKNPYFIFHSRQKLINNQLLPSKVDI